MIIFWTINQSHLNEGQMLDQKEKKILFPFPYVNSQTFLCISLENLWLWIFPWFCHPSYNMDCTFFFSYSLYLTFLCDCGRLLLAASHPRLVEASSSNCLFRKEVLGCGWVWATVPTRPHRPNLTPQPVSPETHVTAVWAWQLAPHQTGMNHRKRIHFVKNV